MTTTEPCTTATIFISFLIWSKNCGDYLTTKSPIQQIVIEVSGVPISWLNGYGITNDYTNAVMSNPDGDAYTTEEEYILDSNPTNYNAAFMITNNLLSNGELSLTFSATSTNRTYTLWQVTNLLAGGKTPCLPSPEKPIPPPSP